MAGRIADARTAVSDTELVITRELDAPRELVWSAWTDPVHVARWWGPRGFTNTVEQMDVRPGGRWRFVMHGPDGTGYRNESVYVEVVKPERIVMDHVSGPRFRMTATFEARGERTVLTWRMTFASAADLARVVKEHHADEGLRENAEKLGEYLGADAEAPRGEVVVTRDFDAPRALVFQAWTRPEHVSRWFPPRGFTMPSCELDFRPGGAYRMVFRAPDGTELPFHGVYREIVPGERIVFSAVIAPVRGGAVVTTVTFEDAGGGRTRVTARQTVPGLEAAARGQRQGWTETLENLDGVVRSLAAR
jgi:uncharacterized protein YndB with AHSA1/START domain